MKNTISTRSISTLSSSCNHLYSINNNGYRVMPIANTSVPLMRSKPSNKTSFIPCYKGKQRYLLNAKDIEYICSNVATGVHIYTSDEEFHTNWTLKTFEE